jgi:hypothetical protein
MNWDEAATRLAERSRHDRLSHADVTIDNVLVYLARTVLGEPAHPFTEIEVDEILGARTSTSISKGMRALAAMCFRRVSVAEQLLDKPLGHKALPNRNNSANASALAYQLATAVAARAPSACVAASMAGLRDAFIAGSSGYDPRLALVAAHLYLHQIAPVDDVPAACRVWLETGVLPQHQSQSTDDVRIKVFEAHQQELADVGLLSRLSTNLAAAATFEPPTDSFTASAVKLFVAGWTLPDGWERAVEPDARAWLGGSSTSAECELTRDKIAYRVRSAALSRRLAPHHKRDSLIEALWLGQRPEVVALSGRKELAAFKPGKLFGGDARALVRYLAAAVEERARPADVADAWHAFLAGRPPFTYDTGHDYIGWRHVAMLQSVITERLGGGSPADVGTQLRATITGSLAR